jgi:hypothetical protein
MLDVSGGARWLSGQNPKISNKPLGITAKKHQKLVNSEAISNTDLLLRTCYFLPLSLYIRSAKIV